MTQPIPKPSIKTIVAGERGLWTLSSTEELWNYYYHPEYKCWVWEKIKVPWDYQEYGKSDIIPEKAKT